MTTDTPDRDNRRGYPCHMPCIGDHCHDVCDFAWDCDQRKIFDAHIKLRNEMRKLRRAVLGELSPEEAAYVYRNVITLYAEQGNAEAERRFNALADVVSTL